MLLRRLAVFAGGFDLDAAEAVGSGDVIQVNEVLDLLSSLVDKSLVIADAGERTRYGLLETVRQYAAERLDEASERATTSDRHLDHFHQTFSGLVEGRISYGTSGVWDAPGTRRYGAHSELERHNLRAALDWAGVSGRGVVALEICRTLYFHWLKHREYQEGRRSIVGRARIER